MSQQSPVKLDARITAAGDLHQLGDPVNLVIGSQPLLLPPTLKPRRLDKHDVLHGDANFGIHRAEGRGGNWLRIWWDFAGPPVRGHPLTRYRATWYPNHRLHRLSFSLNRTGMQALWDQYGDPQTEGRWLALRLRPGRLPGAITVDNTKWTAWFRL